MTKILSVFALLLSISACAGPSDKEIKSRVFMIQSPGGGSCTAEQIKAPSGKQFVLTAAHCRDLHDGKGVYRLKAESGRFYYVKMVAEDPTSDLLLLEAVPEVQGFEIAEEISVGEHVRTFTHGGGYNTYKTHGVILLDKRVTMLVKMLPLERLSECEINLKQHLEIGDPFSATFACVIELDETATSAPIFPGSSGGPVLDDSGDLLGVVSGAGHGEGYLVRLIDIQLFLEKF